VLKSDVFVEKHADSDDSELSGTTWKQWYWYIQAEELLSSFSSGNISEMYHPPCGGPSNEQERNA